MAKATFKAHTTPQMDLPIEPGQPVSVEECQTCRRDFSFLKRQRPWNYEELPDKIKIVDLFSGAGGLTLGTAEAARRSHRGVSVRLALDSDEATTAVFQDNFPQAGISTTPVEQVFDGDLGAPLSRQEKRIHRSIRSLDILVGGPPCQGYSDLNNKTRRKDPRNRLYARMARATEVLRPKAVLIENVPAVIHDSERVVDIVASHLEKCGYRVAQRLIDLTTMGVPQTRRRHVVLALRNDVGEPGSLLASLRPPCPNHPQRTVYWAISDLNDAENSTPFDTASRPTAPNLKRIDWLFDNGKFDLPNELRPDCHKSDHSYVSMYGRLRWDRPAQTITSGFGSMGQGRYVHPGSRRTLTPHEAARLQTFPDFYSFSSVNSRGDWARMIGNAVPPLLGIAIGSRLIPLITG